MFLSQALHFPLTLFHFSTLFASSTKNRHTGQKKKKKAELVSFAVPLSQLTNTVYKDITKY